MSEDKNTEGTIIEFLLGSHSYHGLWFGDKEEGMAPFWWRRVLREHIAAASPVSDAVEFGKWLSENGYRPCDKLFGTWENDADIEIEFTSEGLYKIFKSENPTPTNVQEQDEAWKEVCHKVVGDAMFEKKSITDTVDYLKQNYTITKKQ